MLEEPPGAYVVTARYAGSEAVYLASANLTSFTVEREDSALQLAVVGKGSRRHLEASLHDADQPTGIEGRTIGFSADGDAIGSATTDGNRQATLDLPPRYRNGSHTYTAVFEGDRFFLASRAQQKT